MLSAMPRRLRLPLSISLAALVAVALGACERRGGCTGSDCGTLIDAAIGEPGTLLPPSTEEVVARDIEEQLFLKLADVGCRRTRSAMRTSSRCSRNAGSGMGR